ncbi:hypothetical protein IW140_001815 [Coemansia sp. RSA 1813]|nr:hypothetical protein LPJ74_001535 [Coemansia sp. RSA 1843]KAJ2091162.1 hypothetical protein IW138_002125 [Coemansia sp. RSA 986]KAJ2213582.1 hypothetical protein EV179_003697 [Coemansia sp. RSA 487]KAJ2571113.1 hypothetical protein IW140_001815 [Coemansia sp. RSA 1813]
MVRYASYSKIAVVGTGGYGWHFLKALVHSNHFATVRAVTRNCINDAAKHARIRQLKELGIQIFEYDEATEKAFEVAFKDIDIIVSAVGVAGVPDQIPMIDGALLAGAKWFIPSEYGVVYYPSVWMPFASPLAAKSLVHDHLFTAAKSKGLAHTIVYTGLALDYLDPRSIGLRLAKRTATLVGRGGTPVTFTSVHDVVHLIVDIVKRPLEMQNRTVRYAGSTAKMRDLIKVVTGSNYGERLQILGIDEAKEVFCEYARIQDKRAFPIYTCLLVEEGLAQINRHQEPLDNSMFPELSPEPVRQTLERLMANVSTSESTSKIHKQSGNIFN